MHQYPSLALAAYTGRIESDKQLHDNHPLPCCSPSLRLYKIKKTTILLVDLRNDNQLKGITGGAVEPFLRMGIPHPPYI